MFNRNETARPAADSMAGSSFSVFGADIRNAGDVTAAADLHVDGRIDGDVACTNLVQGEASEIVGAIPAATARLAGTVRGTVSAGHLVVLKIARILGDVHYDALTVEQGAQLEGRLAPRTTAEEPTVLTLAG
jgi:cytoskeletal protein CcmA (bactofilin family)